MQMRSLAVIVTPLIFLSGCATHSPELNRSIACFAIGAALGATVGALIDEESTTAILVPSLGFGMGGGALCGLLEDEVPSTPREPKQVMAGIGAMKVDPGRQILDSDQDGVADASDRCPGTGPLATVDEYGCAVKIMAELDSDGDGVPDSRDGCPNTLPGVQVDDDGCAKVGQTMAILDERILFAFNKADLDRAFSDTLNQIVTTLRKNPNISLDLVGYADSIGTVAYNLELGRRRAEMVQRYLIREGIVAKRLRVISKGESNPAANNINAAGRARNRRVEFVVNGKH